jgi:hypothetical protein
MSAHSGRWLQVRNTQFLEALIQRFDSGLDNVVSAGLGLESLNCGLRDQLDDDRTRHHCVGRRRHLNRDRVRIDLIWTSPNRWFGWWSRDNRIYS